MPTQVQRIHVHRFGRHDAAVVWHAFNTVTQLFHYQNALSNSSVASLPNRIAWWHTCTHTVKLRTYVGPSTELRHVGVLQQMQDKVDPWWKPKGVRGENMFVGQPSSLNADRNCGAVLHGDHSCCNLLHECAHSTFENMTPSSQNWFLNHARSVTLQLSL